jgi:hypothetical protein
MKKILLLTVAVGLLLLASSAFGQYAGPIKMTYNGNNYDGSSWDGFITGFYGGTINGVSVGGSAANPGMLCDDFNTELKSPWSAYAINVSTLLQNWSADFSGTKFGTASNENIYIEMALLVQAAFSGHTALSLLSGVSGTTAGDVSQALWCITGGPSNCNSSGMSAAAYALWQNVITAVNHGNYRLSSFANLWLYVPKPKSGSQEMWSNVPVPDRGAALMYLLLAGASCFGAMFFRSRNQVSRPGIA